MDYKEYYAKNKERILAKKRERYRQGKRYNNPRYQHEYYLNVTKQKRAGKEPKPMGKVELARWLWVESKDGIDHCLCSVCNRGWWENEFPYCPYCGSRMKEVKK